MIFNLEIPDTEIQTLLSAPLFEWVIENLCKNAVDAMDGKGELKITMNEIPEGVCVDVKDTGKGISKSKHKAVFSPGFTTKKRGWGLGLSLSKRIIENYHHGKIFVLQSEESKGTTFRIVLPLTLAIIDGMIINFGTERYVMPLSHVHETLRPAIEDIQQTTALGTILMLRGENMPLFRLGDYFGVASHQHNHEMIAMVVRSGSKPFAILVDDIVGAQIQPGSADQPLADSKRSPCRCHHQHLEPVGLL